MCLSKDLSRNEYSNLIHNRMKQGKNKQTKNQVFITATATAKSLQSCPTLCEPIDSSPPSSPVPGILQARTLEWIVISFSNAWKWKAKVKPLSHVWLLATPWTAVYQAPPSMGFSRQEYWSGVLLPSPHNSAGEHKFKSRWEKYSWEKISLNGIQK